MRLSLLLLVVLLACSRTTIDRTEWQSMSRENRVLYVQSLIATEQAKEAKGGDGKRVNQSPDEFVRMIDAAYARGDQRMPEEIFATLR